MLRFTEARVSRTPNSTTVSTTFRGVDDELELYYRVLGKIKLPVNLGNIWLPLSVIPAMSHQVPLEIHDRTSSLMLANAARVQEILGTWHHRLNKCEITASPGAGPRRGRRRGTIQFFTGGVDSFHTLLTRPSRPDALLYVYGFDVALDDVEHRARVGESLRQVSHDLGIQLFEVESNVRQLLDKYVNWGPIGHGHGLASAAHLFSAEYQHAVIPSSHTYKDLTPWGSHPLIDEKWYSDSLSIEHHGADSSRFKKVAAVAESDLAVRHLRVCWKGRSSMNCSRCEKCIRTMMSLAIVDRLDDATTFDALPAAEEITAMPILTQSKLEFVIENWRAARLHGKKELAAICEQQIRQYRQSNPS